MKTNHARQYVDPGDEQTRYLFSVTKKLSSGKAITLRSIGCETHHNAAQHNKRGIKKALRQAERRDGLKVIQEQLA